VAAADSLYEDLRGTGAEVLFDDRDAGTGEKLTDAELIGCPLRITVGPRGLAQGEIEAQLRATGAEHRFNRANAAAAALDLLSREDPERG
jgi:prolyl-tRNA synthetase